MSDFIDMVLAEARARGFEYDEENPILKADIINGKIHVWLNEKPKQINITFKAGAGDYEYLENLYQSAAGGSPVSAD